MPFRPNSLFLPAPCQLRSGAVICLRPIFPCNAFSLGVETAPQRNVLMSIITQEPGFGFFTIKKTNPCSGLHVRKIAPFTLHARRRGQGRGGANRQSGGEYQCQNSKAVHSKPFHNCIKPDAGVPSRIANLRLLLALANNFQRKGVGVCHFFQP
jgi:hypothetical protein